MKIVFRVNYQTVPGQSLWVKLATVLNGSDALIEQVLPMRWINERQWEAVHMVRATCRLRLEYAYQLQDERNGWGRDGPL